MAKDEKLFQLIKSLSKSEKGFFKKHATMHNRKGNSNYIKLFDAVDAQRAYNEEKLLKKFKKEAFVKHFAVTKKYLFDNILKSLKAYHNGKTIRSRAEQLTTEAELLTRRALFSEALKYIEKAKKLAYEIEYFVLVLQLLEIEWRIRSIYLTENQSERKKEIDKETRETNALIENQDAYLSLYEQFFAFIKKERTIRKDEDKKRFEELMNEPLLKDETLAKGYKSKLLYWGIQATYATLVGDVERSYQCSKNMLTVWDQHPSIKSEQPTYYFSSICNYLNRVYKMKKVGEMRESIQRLKNIQPHCLSQEIRCFERYHLYSLSLMELTHELEGLDEAANEIESGLEEYDYGLMVNEKRLLFFNLTALYLTQGACPKAKVWVERLTDLPRTDTQLDLQRFSQVLGLLVALGNDDRDAIEEHYKKLKRKIKQEKKMYRYEQLLSDFAEQNLIKKRALVEFSAAFYDQFAELREDDYERRAFEYFDLLTWLRAQAEETTMLELYQAKN